VTQDAGQRNPVERDGQVPIPEPLTSPAVDSHCHLDLLAVPVAEALAASRAAGVPRVVTVGVDVASSRWSADTAAEFEGVVAAVAMHPNEAAESADLDADLAAITELAALPQVRAVGETGLDYYRTGEAGRPAQERSFRRHIALAKATGKALVIHDRDAHDDVLRVLDDEGDPETVVMHCFSGGADFARRCTERGFVLSFAGNVTFKNAGLLREAVAVTPLDQLLVETDAPFLTPVPFRGRHNAPHLIPLTLRAIAEQRGVPIDELAQLVTATATRVFGDWG
jgi:TatD DNase family protein